MTIKKIFIAGSVQLANKYAYGNTVEGVQAQKIVDYMMTEFKNYNAKFFRTTLNPYMDLNESAKKANDLGCTSYYAIHTNAGGGHGVTAIKQTSLFVPKARRLKSAKMATELCDAIEGLGRHNRGTFGRKNIIGQEYYSDLRQPKMASTILEIEFHDYVEGAKWIVDNKALIGRTLARRIAKIEGLFRIYKATTTASLNVRTGAGVSFPKASVTPNPLPKGTVVHVYEEMKNETNVWCRIDPIKELWVAKAYLKK